MKNIGFKYTSKIFKLQVVLLHILLLTIIYSQSVFASQKMTDLGDLGGYPMTIVHAMNEKGQIVGSSIEADSNNRHAFLWENGVMRDLGTLGGNFSMAYGINSNGQIIGKSYTADNKTHAFLWENGKMTDLGTLGGSHSYAAGINDKGQVVGYSDCSGDDRSHAFLWENGKMTDLGTLGGSHSYASGINNKGQIIGCSDSSGYMESHAFLWQNGKMTDLGTLGGSNSSVVAINENGQILCNSDTNNSFNRQAFIWQNGKRTKIGTLGGSESFATAINESGQVVGASYLSDNKTNHGFVWSNGKMTDCTPSGTFERILINNKGQICVEFRDSNGKSKVQIRNNGTITELGTLGGSNTYLKGLNNSGNVVGYSQTAEDGELNAFYWANGQMNDLGISNVTSSSNSIFINNNGQISCSTYDKIGISHGFQWYQEKLTDIGNLGGLNKITYVTGMNDKGQVIGVSNTCENSTHCYVWKDNIITDLGVPGKWSHAKAINNKGQIIGEHYYDDAGNRSGFLWDNGKITELGTLGEENSEVIAINEKGQIIGFAYTEPSYANGQRAFVWDNGKMVDMGTFGGTTTTPVAINNNGQVIGNSLTENYQTRGFIWQNGKMTDLGTLGGDYSEAIAINDKGQVIGVSNISGNTGLHGFIWENGKMTDLGTLGGRYSSPVAINNKGQITGTSSTPDNSSHGFIWENGKITDLGTLGGQYSTPKAINELGQIIGTSTTVSRSTVAVGFIWQNGKMTSLGTLGGSTSNVKAINNKGEVIGTSKLKGDDNATWHAFFWYDGKMIDMGTLGGRRSDAYYINNSGYVAGTALDKYEIQKGYVWSLYPQITIEDYVQTPTNQDIIVKARTNEGVLNESSHTFTENGSFTFIATGDDGTTSSLDITVTNIDKTAPVISLLGSPYIKIKAGDPFVDEGAAAMDNLDGDITGYITVKGIVDNTEAGLYTLQYDVTDQAGNRAQTVQRQIEVIPTISLPAIGYIDSPKANQYLALNRVYRLKGWLLDPVGVQNIEILVDDNVIGAAVYGDSRPDVAKIYPNYNNQYSGFHYYLDTSLLNEGSHTLKVRETGNTGLSRIISTKTFNVTSMNVRDTAGYFDFPIDNSTLSGKAKVSGWFGDTMGVSKIEVMVDNIKVGQAVYGDYRPDVPKIYPYFNSYTGFHYELNTLNLTNGTHTLTIIETSTNGEQTQMPPKTITILN